jgi:SAM-dependent methyltransferase
VTGDPQYRNWLPQQRPPSRTTRMTAWLRRRMVRLLTRLSAIPATRRLGELGHRWLFDSLAPQWDRIRADPVYGAAMSKGLAGVQVLAPQLPLAHAYVLDVACGTGMAAHAVLELAPTARVLGVDISPRMVEIAGRRVPQAQFEVGSATAGLRFPDQSFQLVVSLDGVFDPAEVARLVAPGGCALIVYSKGAQIPVVRPIEGIVEAFTAAGLQARYDTDGPWIVWGVRGLG